MKPRIQHIWATLFSVLLTLASLTLGAYAADAFKIISLQYRLAKDILPTIQPLVDENGVVSASQNHLIIRTSDENMAQIEQVISVLDKPQVNYKIRVNLSHAKNGATQDYRVSGQTRIGDIELQTGNNADLDHQNLQIDLNNRRTETTTISSQILQILEGERGFISTGQSIPYTQVWVTLTERFASAQKTTTFINIQTGFSVRLRSVHNKLLLEISPTFMQMQKNQTIVFEQLSTMIAIEKNQWIDLSSIMRKNDEVSRAILARSSRQNHEEIQLKIHVE
ncbi:MAG: nodulation protein NolW [Betaproteobacteria bacterium HGW-Betaproteobacteria-22]|nr:MAG: nodulation protein NolW [Betaproteobacteria bacterium HGW-Betaproteobacteria-22]